MQAMSLAPHQTPLVAQPRLPTGPPKRALSKDEQEEIRFAFDTLDFAKEGAVTPKHLKVALRAMGFPVKKQDVAELLRKLGEEDTARIDFNVFQRVVSDKLAERSAQDDVRRAFALFDVHGQGRVDLPALRKVVKSLGLDLPEAELQDMILEFDTDGDGAINEAEFLAVMSAADD